MKVLVIVIITVAAWGELIRVAFPEPTLGDSIVLAVLLILVGAPLWYSTGAD